MDGLSFGTIVSAAGEEDDGDWLIDSDDHGYQVARYEHEIELDKENAQSVPATNNSPIRHSAAGHSLAAMPCSEIHCGCCGRKPAKFRGEMMTAVGWVPLTTCRWCEASGTRFRKSQNSIIDQRAADNKFTSTEG